MTDNIQDNASLLNEVDDSNALAEIQKSVDQIEQLKNTENTPQSDEQKEEEEEPLGGLEEPESSLVPETDKNEKKTEQYRKLQNDKYKALAEKAAAEERIKELEQMLSDSVQSGTYHYGTKVYGDLERAKADKRKAIEEGNVDALIEADIALTKSLTAANELEKWATENKPRKPIESNSNDIDIKIKQEMASDWLDNHPDLKPTSKYYDQKLAGEVAEFINHMDSHLQRSNQMEGYYSPYYFNAIDDYIEDLKSKRENQPSNNETVSNHIGGVRNSYSAPVRTKSPTQITLTVDEKRMCANAGISEQEWIKAKLEDNKLKRKL